MYNVLNHPDAPAVEELSEYVVEPVAPDVIERRREAGETLVEANLLEHDAIDAYVELSQPDEEIVDVGTVLYRLVQLFGTPQFPEYRAGEDISWRHDETFKYLLSAREGAEAPVEGDPEATTDDGRLLTVFDYHVGLGIGLAAWHDGPDATVDVETEEAIALMALITHAVTDPVQCEYEDLWF
jgi:hypothetical protein